MLYNLFKQFCYIVILSIQISNMFLLVLQLFFSFTVLFHKSSAQRRKLFNVIFDVLIVLKLELI